MTFLEEFDKLDVWDANALLYNRIIHDYDALFAELREHRPVLKFWSHHPGNADLKEKGPGYAYLLSRADQVQHALQNFSMQPYNAIPQSPFVLTIDNVAQHDKVRASMTRALALDEPQQISDLIQEAVDLEWRDVSGRLPIIDIRAFVRNAALRFTGSYFGIPEEYIFSPVPVPPQLKASVSGFECLKQWSGEGYENFIWKIHARHFGSPEPQMQNALQKIYFLIGKMMAESPLPNTVIGRFMLEREHFPSNHHIIVNIIGMIQGLVDNVMTGACYALNQFIAQGQVDQVRDLTVSQLIDAIRKIHKRDTPSPFLPRRGALNAFDGFTSANPETNFACAIGSALNDPNHDSGDIRLGYGMHECIGRDIGDEIKARSLAVILKLGNLKITEPLEKQWGWIVRRFEVAGEQLDEHENGRIVRNRNAINSAAFATTPRPRPYGLWSGSADVVSDYTSWPALSDRTFFSRHLPPATAEYSNALPNNTAPESKSYGDVTELFRRQGEQTGSRSSLLFAFFAQWFTDSFLRTEPDRRKTSSNHQIDMCQIYGLKEATTNILRQGSAGKLKTEPTLTDGEYLPYLFDSSGRVKPEFRGLPYVEDGRYRTILEKIPDAETKKETYFATGLERGNSTCGYAALSTLFLREHNRICDSLRQKNPKWGDERLFQTARMIVTALELKIVIEEYINHISGIPGLYSLDTTFAEKQPWYRTNWIALEFDLLYRWHSLIPDNMVLGGENHSPGQFLANNKPLVDKGLANLITEASTQRAGQIGLFNTPEFLLDAEEAAIKMSRSFKLQSFNRYRKQFRLPAIDNFDNFPADDDVTHRLKELYTTTDNVEFLVGLYAEQRPPETNMLFGMLMTRMVAYDAFTHALTNPLLSRNIFKPETFTKFGWDTIAATSSLQGIINRNTSDSAVATFDVSMGGETDHC